MTDPRRISAPIRIEIDPNVRTKGNRTYTGYEDVVGGVIPQVDEHVIVFESESGVEGPAQVFAIAAVERLIYLTVDWQLLRAVSA